jgi:hypothetical protein
MSASSSEEDEDDLIEGNIFNRFKSNSPKDRDKSSNNSKLGSI